MSGSEELETLICEITCGCGKPEEDAKYILHILKTRSEYDLEFGARGNGSKYFDLPKDIFPKHYAWRELTDKPYNRIIMNMLDDKGFMNHGGSIFGAWLTEKGEGALKILLAAELAGDL